LKTSDKIGLIFNFSASSPKRIIESRVRKIYWYHLDIQPTGSNQKSKSKIFYSNKITI